MDALKLWTLVASACSGLVACKADVDAAAVTTEGSSSSTTGAVESSTTVTEPEPLRFGALAIAGERLCAIEVTDGRVLCRDRAQCDVGRDPGEWDLADPACWVEASLPATSYFALALARGDASACAVRSDDGTVECESAPSPTGRGYIDVATNGQGTCATDGHNMRCVGELGKDGAGFTALDETAALTSSAILALTQCGADLCGGSFEGEFVEVFGYPDAVFAGYGCGLRRDGTVACPVGSISVVGERPIVEVALGNSGTTYCVRFDDASVECNFEPPPPDDPLVAIEMSSAPASYACGVRAADASMVCWGAAFPWCGDALCDGGRECVADRCLDCSEGCTVCGDDVCQGSDCIDGRCGTCVELPCSWCGDALCHGAEECLGGACIDCGDGECTPCGAMYCPAELACVDDACVPRCNDTADCPTGAACIDEACTPFGVPECDDGFAFSVLELPLPDHVRGTPVAFDAGPTTDLLVAGLTGAWVVHGPDFADATELVDHDGQTALVPAVGDLDDDRDLELAIADLGSATVTIYDHTDEWSPLLSHPLPAADEGRLVVADADGDELGDLLFADVGGQPTGVSWHRNLGVGMGFIEELDVLTTVQTVAQRAGDLDRNGVSDYAVASFERARYLAPATDLALVSMDPSAGLPAAPLLRAVTIADFDGDGEHGLAVLYQAGDTAWIEVWAEPARPSDDTHWVVSLAEPLVVDSVALATDVDGDGDDDLVMPAGATIRVWFGSGSQVGPFACTEVVAWPGITESMTAADVDADGAHEVIVAGPGNSAMRLLTADRGAW